QGFSVKQVIDVARTVCDRSIPVQMGQRRPGDPPRLIGDASRAKTELGWQPAYADLETIVRTAWQWLLLHSESLTYG
ncbi:MAG: GDP-mannose 4,6-dehydratase, partial [Cyanobacteria bacterium P01_F01_bin.33]